MMQLMSHAEDLVIDQPVALNKSFIFNSETKTNNLQRPPAM